MPPRPDATFFDRLHTLFATLQPDEVEQFYTAYRQWFLQQRIVELRQRLVATQEEIVENERRMQEVHPSSLALASLARLQANGVNDIDLLDAMLERGEAWLDATMQRLDYCEQFENFLTDDYTQWARLALEGAFDWIDSALTPASAGTQGEQPASIPVEVDAGEAEAQFLQLLASEVDEDEDDLSWQEPTLKQAAVVIPRDAPVGEERDDMGEAVGEENTPVETPGEPDPTAEPEQENLENAADEVDEVDEVDDVVAAPAHDGEADNADEAEMGQPAPPPAYKKRSLSRRLIGKLLGE